MNRNELMCCLQRSLCLAAGILVTAVPGSAQDEPQKKSVIAPVADSAPVPTVTHAEMYKPGIMPDRVILTWNDDPTTTQAVTWRTSAAVAAGVAQITISDGGPKLEENSTRHAATTQPLTTDLGDAHYHSVTFTDLQPGTTYAYRVGDGTNWSEWFQFRTAAGQPEPFSFLYFGDAQNDLRSRWSRVIREAFTDTPRARFMIHAGDLINNAEADGEWGEWFAAGGWMNAMIPSVPIPGNHEMAKTGLVTRRLTHHWRPQFALPEHGPPGMEETCYTLVYQNVRLIGLDSNQNHHAQVEWLEQVLAENKSPWVVCTFHFPLFSTGKNRDNKALRDLWKPVLDKYRVDLVLQGHDHSYGRTGLETPASYGEVTNAADGVKEADLFTGTVYVVSVSGPKMYELQRHPFMKRHAEDTQLYQVIHVDGDKMHYEAHTSSGELYDAFTLQKQPGKPNTMTERVPESPERLRPPAAPQAAKKAAVRRAGEVFGK